MKKVIFLFYLFSFIQCSIKVSDFCNKIKINGKEVDCKNNYSSSCGEYLCAKDRYSCQSIKLHNALKAIQRNEREYILLENQLDLFLKLIKNCPKPFESKWKPNDVCLNDKDCLKAHGYGIWSSLLTPNECKCQGKYAYRCNSYLCGINRQACDGLKNNIKIKKCIQYK
jgi:hypothetical protein